MSSLNATVDLFDYIIFGGGGDLAERKLLPALFHRDRDNNLPDGARIVGVSRTARTDDDYREFARKALQTHVASEDLTGNVLERFLSRLSYISVDATGANGWKELKTFLEKGGTDRIRAFYLAVAPTIFGTIAAKLKSFGLINTRTRLVIEKPIGRDLASAHELNAEIARHFDEDQIFRIDHYLGKETVQNLMALRFANTLYDPVWNSSFIDHVQITVAESVGLGTRAGYYDKAGALRDMVQNHLLQLLALVALEPPSTFKADAIRDEKLKVLRALKPITATNVRQLTVRGQYRAGAGDGGAVPAYLDDLGAPTSDTETFVALKAEINNWRWAGVPFYLRTGKRLPTRASEIVMTFKPIPLSIFDESSGLISQNRLVLRLQPGEGVKQWLMIKDPGPGGMRLRQVSLDMSFAEQFNIRQPDAYERLLMDVVRSDQSLFMRRDEVEAAWEWVDPVLAAWQETDQKVQGYASGTWGPSGAIALIERDGRTWHEPE